MERTDHCFKICPWISSYHSGHDPQKGCSYQWVMTLNEIQFHPIVTPDILSCTI